MRSIEAEFELLKSDVALTENQFFVVLADENISTIPPDDVYTVMDYCYPENVVILNDTCMLKGEEGSVILGGLATGMGSLSSDKAEAYGENSFAACYSHANGQYSSALGCGKATTYCSFAANIGESHGSCSAAVNTGLAFSPYSFSHGYKTITLGRPLKALSLDIPSKSIVIDSAYSLSGIYAGNKIMIRCRNGLEPLIYNQAKVKSVSGNTIYYEDETYVGDGSSSAYRLFPDGYIFMIDNSITYATSSESGGYYTISSGKYTSSNGYYTIAMADGANIWGKYGINTEPYSIALANGNSFEHPSLAFKVLSTGSVHADSEYTTPCADYAEFFEWDDGNENAEDRTGYFVKLVGEKITKCDEFDEPLGIVSATPAIVGDSGELHWKDKFVTDDFGRIQYHDVIIPEEKDEEGNIIIEEHIETQPVLNPQWNADEVYIPRKERKEWSPVGVFGKLIVYDDGTLKQGDICRPGKGGIAVKSVKNGYQVLKRISDDKIMIWFRG